MRLIALFAFLQIFSLSHSAGLVDNPIVGDSIVRLDGPWVLSDGSRQLPATVPGDIISDLYNAGLVGDPLYETNWLQDSSVWAGRAWAYSKIFPSPSLSGVNEVYLVFDGIKMGATITLNNVVLGKASDQFLRYTFPVKQLLKAQNVLNVTFAKGIGGDIDCEGRFMACTGGWDWSPYSNTYDQHGAHTLSFGIWKSVYLTSVNSVGIEHVVPQVFWTRGDYPTKPLTSQDPLSFTVKVTAYLIAPAPIDGVLHVTGGWGVQSQLSIHVPAGQSNFQLQLTANSNIKLWWPNGLGGQPLYKVTVTFTPSTNANPISDSRNVGFRVVALVTADDSDPSKISGKDGSGALTMRLRINGANVWLRGGNMIPMENYEARANADAFSILVNSAADANFNVFRIWGGGIFLYDAFYDQCDTRGIIMYHDMMYAQSGHSPSATQIQDQEIRHNVRRLSHHPSIVIWDGCNECGGQGIYNDFVVNTIVTEDKSRAVWPSCPADGYQSGVDMLWGFPNGNPLVPRKPGSEHFETHGPYQHGTGFKTVDDPSGNLQLFSANLPPALKQGTPAGPTLPGVFASEFGCVGMSSFESMAETLSKEHWSLHAPPMAQRNYPCDNIIQVYWGKQNLDASGELPFKKQLYQCLLGQALELKSDIEVRRSTNEWGTITWQINEIWPTGGWGSIEYGTPTKAGGQVIGGRWKPLHHWLAGPVFNSIIATCSASDPPRCYVKNDGILPFSGTVEIGISRFADGQKTVINTLPVSLESGAGVIQWFCAKGTGTNCASWADILSSGKCAKGAADCILTTQVTSSGGITVSENFVPLTIPQTMNLPAPKLTWAVDVNGTITLTSDTLALFVTLTTTAQGRFSENAFIMYPGTKIIHFVWFTTKNVPSLQSSLRVEHVQMYQQ